MEPSESGRRILPHTADLIIEAWGPGKAACLEEATRALVESFARITGTPVTERVPIQLAGEGNDTLFVSVLDELIYIIDALGCVPVGVALEETEDGGAAGFFDIVPVDCVEIIGPSPKGVSFEDLVFEQRDGVWHCRAIIDV